MTTLQKGILWSDGVPGVHLRPQSRPGLVLLGYLDAGTLGLMGLMLAPVLAVAGWYTGWKAGGPGDLAKAASQDMQVQPRFEVSSLCERR